jgi:vitamin-K-epoxide reductase (warfarin-sensitive)
MTFLINLFAFIGFVLSLYSFYVERKLIVSSNYHPICDINDKVSCSKAFTSRYGKLGGLSNSVYGVLFYLIIFFLVYVGNFELLFYLSLLGFLGSLVLAYLLYFKLEDFCLVCSSIYLVNFLLFLFSWIKFYG